MKYKKIIWLVPSIKNTLEESYKKSLEKCNIFIDLYCYRNKIIEKGYKGFIYDLKRTCRNSDLVLFTLWSGSHLLSPKLMKDIKKNSKSWQKELYIRGDMHFNQKGNFVLAEIIADQLKN